MLCFIYILYKTRFELRFDWLFTWKSLAVSCTLQVSKTNLAGGCVLSSEHGSRDRLVLSSNAYVAIEITSPGKRSQLIACNRLLLLLLN